MSYDYKRPYFESNGEVLPVYNLIGVDGKEVLLPSLAVYAVSPLNNGQFKSYEIHEGEVSLHSVH